MYKNKQEEYISTLPSEVLSKIGSELDQSSLRNLSRTSKNIRHSL